MAIERDMVLSFKGDPSSAIRALNQVQGKLTEVNKSTKAVNESWKMMKEAAAGFLAFKTVEMVGKFEDGIRRVGINAGLSASKMMQLKEGLLDVSSGASTEEMMQLSKSFLDVNKNSDFYLRNLKYITALQEASGASGADLGKALGDLMLDSKMTDEQFKAMTATMLKFSQGKFSKMSFAEILPNAKQMLAAARLAYGPNASTKQIQDFMTTAMFTGSPQALAKAMIKMKTNPLVSRMMTSIGADVSKDTLGTILAKAQAHGASIVGIGQLFGKQGIAGLERLINQTKEWQDAMASAGGTAEDVLGQADEKSKGFEGSMNRLNKVFLTLADSALAPVLQQVADSLSKVDPESIKALAGAFGTLGTIVGRAAENLGNLIGWMEVLHTQAQVQQLTDDVDKATKEGIAFRRTKAGKAAGQGAPSSFTPSNENLDRRNSLLGMGVDPNASSDQAQALANSMFTGSEGKMPISLTANLNVSGENIFKAKFKYDIPNQMAVSDR